MDLFQDPNEHSDYGSLEDSITLEDDRSPALDLLTTSPTNGVQSLNLKNIASIEQYEKNWSEASSVHLSGYFSQPASHIEMDEIKKAVSSLAIGRGDVVRSRLPSDSTDLGYVDKWLDVHRDRPDSSRTPSHVSFQHNWEQLSRRINPSEL